MSESVFVASVTIATNDNGDTTVAVAASEPVSVHVVEAFESEEGRSETAVAIAAPDVSETHFLEGDDGDGLEIEILGPDDDDGDDADTPLAAEGNVHALPH